MALMRLQHVCASVCGAGWLTSHWRSSCCSQGISAAGERQHLQQFAVCFSPRQRLRHTRKYVKSHQNNGWVPCPPDPAVPVKLAWDIQRLRSQAPTDSFGLLSCVVPWGFAVGVQGVCGGSGRAVGGQQATTQAAATVSSMDSLHPPYIPPFC